MHQAWLSRSISGRSYAYRTRCLFTSIRIQEKCHDRAFITSSAPAADVIPLRKQLKDASKAARAGTSDHRKETTGNVATGWELTVGIEIHAQLNTARKLFSRSPSESDGDPNGQLASFDVALPGSQPRLQIATLIPAIRAALALNCEVQPVSLFDRKHYFYHDQPAGYQITQYYHPFATGGWVGLTADDGLAPNDGDELVVGIKQIQMEQDTAKTQELEDGSNLIDFNRSGQPLVEIISLPHIHSPEAAAAYMRKVQSILYTVDAVTTGMELGGLRADVNVSVRRFDDQTSSNSYGGVTGLGQRTEIKNLSSFKAVEDAVKAERDRQIRILEQGGVIDSETRGWSISNPTETRRLRGKEGEIDYRYMPDPDIAPLYIGRDLIEHLSDTLPKVPEQLVTMLVDRYGLSKVDARSLIALDDGQRLDFFQQVIESLPGDDCTRYGRIVGNWVLHEIGSLLATNDVAWSSVPIRSSHLASLVDMHESNKITATSARQVLKTLFHGDQRAVVDIIDQDNLWFMPMTDSEYQALASQVIGQNAKIVQEIREKGRHGKVQFLIGQMMKQGDRNRMEASKAEAVLRSTLLG